MDHQQSILLDSEVGSLNAVLLHRPGPEIEQMTPLTVKQALYSDLLSMDVAAKEYVQLEEVLRKCTNVYYIDTLVSECLKRTPAREYLFSSLKDIGLSAASLEPFINLDSDTLTQKLIEGSSDGVLQPLYNLYFMRDLGACFNSHSMPMQMSTKARANEILLTDMLYQFHPLFTKSNAYVNPWAKASSSAHMEGGDFIVANKDLVLIGQGCRSNRKGVEAFIKEKSKYSSDFYVITQDLPSEPESFIHLDMVFTLLNREECMIYAPLILDSPQYITRLLTVKNGEIKENIEDNILTALKKIGYNYKPILCGGTNRLYQDREQWHSGANFFSFAPGKIMGYVRNRYTIEALSSAGYEVVSASEIISGQKEIDNKDNDKKVVVTIESAELVRGGGGCRCMTMPISRKNIEIR